MISVIIPTWNAERTIELAVENEIICDGINGKFLIDNCDYLSQIKSSLNISSADVKSTFNDKFSLDKMIASNTEEYIGKTL